MNIVEGESKRLQLKKHKIMVMILLLLPTNIFSRAAENWQHVFYYDITLKMCAAIMVQTPRVRVAKSWKRYWRSLLLFNGESQMYLLLITAVLIILRRL